MTSGLIIVESVRSIRSSRTDMGTVASLDGCLSYLIRSSCSNPRKRKHIETTRDCMILFLRAFLFCGAWCTRQHVNVGAIPPPLESCSGQARTGVYVLQSIPLARPPLISLPFPRSLPPPPSIRRLLYSPANRCIRIAIIHAVLHPVRKLPSASPAGSSSISGSHAIRCRPFGGGPRSPSPPPS